MLKKFNVKYGIFTVLKYIEFAMTAFVTFSVSNLVTPLEYGEATTAFLTITYALFGSLGINQVLLKWHSIHEKLVVRNFLLQYNLLYSMASALILAPIIYFVLNSLDYRFYVVMICVLKLVQDSIVNINRVSENIYTINIIYLSYSICFFLLYVFCVIDMASFFEMWCYSLVVSVTTGMVSLTRFKNIFRKVNVFSFYLRQYFKRLLTDGVKLAFVAFITPWFLTIDRLILINFTDVNKSQIGTIQLSDNISSVFTIFFSSIIFIFSPQIIEKLNSGEWTINFIYRKGLTYLVATLVFVLVSLFPLNLITDRFFSQYQNLSYMLSFYLIVKTISIFTVIPNLICLAYSRETLYIKISLVNFFVLLIFYFLAVVCLDDYYLFYVFPAILLTMSVFMMGHYYYSIRQFKTVEIE